jgi:ubiquinol-cytochrome c reductase cytochrome b subunit
MGDYNPADATLNRFFALHVIALPLVLLLLVVLHIAALHEVGSNNPDGVEIKKGPKGNRWSPTAPADGIPFHPYYTTGKDLFGVAFFLILCAFIIFFQPTVGGWFLENDSFIPANNLVTPAEIKLVWYFTPYYAILRVIPSKGLGVLMLAPVLAPFLIPWLDRGTVIGRYRGRGSKRLASSPSHSSSSARSVRARRPVDSELFGANADLTSIENLFGRTLTAIYFGFFVFRGSIPTLATKDQTGTGAGDHPCMSRRTNQP